MQWRHRNVSHTYSLKSEVVGLEMFLKELYRVQHEFENEGNLKILACNDLYLTKKRYKWKIILFFISHLNCFQYALCRLLFSKKFPSVFRIAFWKKTTGSALLILCDCSLNIVCITMKYLVVTKVNTYISKPPLKTSGFV